MKKAPVMNMRGLSVMGWRSKMRGAGLMIIGLGLGLAGCASTPAPVITPMPSASAVSSSATVGTSSSEQGLVAGAGASPQPSTKSDNQASQEEAWTSTIIQGSPSPTTSPTVAASAPAKPSSSAPAPLKQDLPDRFENKSDRLVKDACKIPAKSIGDGWWVVMIAGRAPESKNPEDWKYFGLLVDPVCFKGGDGPSISNPGGELRWLRLSDEVRLTCAEGMTPCAIGLFRRPLPPYPPGKIGLGERQWPVAAIRINGGQIDRVEEIVMPGDLPRTPDTNSGIQPPIAQPGAQPGHQPPGTLGSGG